MLTIEKFLELSGSDITPDDIAGRSRKEKVAIAREVYWYCLQLQGFGHRQIARIGCRTRQTITSGIQTVRNLIAFGHPLVKPYRVVVELLTPQSL